MSKLSPTLKALVNAEFARPGPTSASAGFRALLEKILHDAKAKDVGVPAWLALTTATTFTMNSPEALTEIFNIGSQAEGGQTPVQVAELMREVGLKCIGFNGIPRTINCLGAFRSSLPEDVVKQLTTEPRRVPTRDNIEPTKARGIALWKSIYDPFAEKLTDKLAQSHPDLPVHIHTSHYGPLFSDPPESSSDPTRNVGRVLTSLVAIACLRAQTGVGPQVTSHLFGLRKAFENEQPKEMQEQVQGGQFLATDEGNQWILKQVDQIVGELGHPGGTAFAPGYRAKL